MAQAKSLPVQQNISQTEHFRAFRKVRDYQSAVNTVDRGAVKLARYFFECHHDLWIVFEFSLFEDWNDAYLALDARWAVFKLRENKLDLGHEEEATVNADLVWSFSWQSVLVVNQFAGNNSELFTLIFELDLAAIDRHLRRARWRINAVWSWYAVTSFYKNTCLLRVFNLLARPALEHVEKRVGIHFRDLSFSWENLVDGLLLGQLLRRNWSLLSGPVDMLVWVFRLHDSILLFVAFLAIVALIRVLRSGPIFSALSRFQNLSIRIVSFIQQWFFRFWGLILKCFMRRLHQFCGSLHWLRTLLLFLRRRLLVMCFSPLFKRNCRYVEITFLADAKPGRRFTFPRLVVVSLGCVLQLLVLELRVRPFAGHIWV